MANINVKRRLLNIAEEMGKIAKHVKLYSGVSALEHDEVIASLREISDSADSIAAEATRESAPVEKVTRLLGHKVSNLAKKNSPEYDEGVVVEQRGDSLKVRWKRAGATYDESIDDVKAIS